MVSRSSGRSGCAPARASRDRSCCKVCALRRRLSPGRIEGRGHAHRIEELALGVERVDVLPDLGDPVVPDLEDHHVVVLVGLAAAPSSRESSSRCRRARRRRGSPSVRSPSAGSCRRGRCRSPSARAPPRGPRGGGRPGPTAARASARPARRARRSSDRPSRGARNNDRRGRDCGGRAVRTRSRSIALR